MLDTSSRQRKVPSHLKWHFSNGQKAMRIRKLTAPGLKYSLLTLMFLLVLSVSAQRPHETGNVNKDDDLGQIVDDTPPEEGEDQGHVDPNYVPIMPFTEIEGKKKTQLEQKFTNADSLGLTIDSIEPEGGPITGETRVLVRGGPFEDMTLLYPRPKCKFGANDRVVEATYVKCHEKPLKMEDNEGKSRDKTAWCLQCDNSPAVSKPHITSLMITLTGDFTDSSDSEPFRYYNNTRVHAIYPRYGPKDGGTVVQVWGDNFLNYDENLRCNFGTKSVKAVFKSSTYLICKAPFSDNTNKPITFSVSLNKQQQSRDLISYWFYSNPILAKLEPNFGPEEGGDEIILKGSNMHPFIDEPLINNANDTFCIFSDLNVKTPARLINATKMGCVVPASFDGIMVTGVDFTLNNQNYTDDDVPYYYYKPPKLYDMTPKDGPTKGGTHVRLFASDFKKNKHILCVFEGVKTVKTRAKVISDQEIECVSPEWPQPQKVNVYVTYQEDGDKSKSTSLPFTYYETPEVRSIEPKCGPTYGYTQITVIGKNFMNLGLNKAKCIFNDHTYMNVTIISDTELKCSSPPMTRAESLMPYQAMRHTIEVTLNGYEKTNNQVKFWYYPDPEISQVLDSPLGPVEGGTDSTVMGRGFKHENVCNLKIRYSALEVTPQIVNNTMVKTVSPRVSVPDAVILAPSGNGQNYGADITLHHRDIENTFTYYQKMFVHDLHPQAGPTSGNTRILVSGIGFKQFKYDNGTLRHDVPLFAKFVDAANGQNIGEVQRIDKIKNDEFPFYTPKAQAGTQAILMLSFNRQQWQQIIPSEKSYTYLYFNAPIVTSIDPQYGPVKSPNGEKAIIHGQNFECPHGDCSKLRVRFGDIENGTILPGNWRSPSEIEVSVPKYTKPDVLPVEVSMNGDDYTNDMVTYGFYDAYVLNVSPRLIARRGGTKLTIKGFGFVNSGSSEIASKFGSLKHGNLLCSDQTPCTAPAKFVDKNTITTQALPQSQVLYGDRSNIGEDPMTVEVSVYGSSFTENDIEVYYIYDPEYKKLNTNAVPRNLQVPLLIDTNFHWENNDKEMFYKYSNFTCRFTLNDKQIVTIGRMETLPLGASYSRHGEPQPLPDHVVCPSAKMPGVGLGKLQISANGVDYDEQGFSFEFQDAADLFRIAPQSGPKETGGKIKVIGGGLKTTSQTYAKVGNFQLQTIVREQVQSSLWNTDEYLGSMLMNQSDLRQFKAIQHKLEEKQSVHYQYIKTQGCPTPAETHGGPVFMSVGQVLKLDVLGEERSGRLLDDEEQPAAAATPEVTAAKAQEDTAEAQPEVEAEKKTEPAAAASTEHAETPAAHEEKHDTITAGSGAAHIDPGHVEATGNQSTVPKSTTTKIGTPGDRYLFTESPVEYYYYHNPIVKKVQPTQGVYTGGTAVEISGAWFDEKLDYGVIPYCKIGEKIVRAQFSSTVRIICYAPPNDNLSQALPVKVSLNGVDWVDSGFFFSYYYPPEVNSLSPASGIYQGGTEIMLHGNRFSNITDPSIVKCRFSFKNGTDGWRETANKTMPAFYMDSNTMMCMSPNGFMGGDKVYVQLTFNDNEYSDVNENLIFNYYALFGSFPHSGPADGFNEVILVRGAGLNIGGQIFCHLNKTDVLPVSVADDVIQCPMVLPTKDPLVTGYVQFGLNYDGNFNDFGQFYYYNQISFGEITPNYGPSEGAGEIMFTGDGFREDFQGVEIGCKLGNSIGQGEIVEPGTIKCVVEEMALVDEGEGLLVQLALNSYSWVGGRAGDVLYVPYGIIATSPSSGPYDGYTDVMISGRGFSSQFADKGRCRFGVEANYAVVDAEVLDYTKLVCRSPEEFALPEGGDQKFSVPIGIAFGDEEFKPWTLSTHRYRFYQQPAIEYCYPEEVRIGKFAEIYVYAAEDALFFEPLPSGKNGDVTGILCNFDQFGTSMGMYINETTVMCVTPHIQGHPEDYARETVQVTIAMNGQDFNDIQSDAYITFVGTGSDSTLLKLFFLVLLLALLIVACVTFLLPKLPQPPKEPPQPNTISIRGGGDSVTRHYTDGYDNKLISSRQGM